VGSLSHPVLYLHGVLFQLSPSSDFGENQLSRGLISLSLLLSSHLRIFQHSRVRSSTVCYHSFNLLKSRSPPLRVYCQRLVALFVLAFASPPSHRDLSLPLTITRRLIMQKAGSHPVHLSAAQWIFKAQSFAPTIDHSGQMDGAPTHCRQLVAGTISLP
jgi:hypothetical protein